MDIALLILLVLFGILLLLMIIFTQKGQYRTTSYKINPYIDRRSCIELVICDQYLKKKSFFVSYEHSGYLESKNDICITFIKIPIIHRKPRIIDVYIGKEKINVE